MYESDSTSRQTARGRTRTAFGTATGQSLLTALPSLMPRACWTSKTSSRSPLAHARRMTAIGGPAFRRRSEISAVCSRALRSCRKTGASETNPPCGGFSRGRPTTIRVADTPSRRLCHTAAFRATSPPTTFPMRSGRRGSTGTRTETGCPYRPRRKRRYSNSTYIATSLYRTLFSTSGPYVVSSTTVRSFG